MDRDSDKKTAEEKIGEFLRFGSRLGLERMTVLMHKLGDPQDDLNVIHIAGTNGKGSCARFIYETLIAAGRRAGIYTSPYLEKFNERIEFMGQMITDEELSECTDEVLEKVAEMISEGNESPTEFEVVTAVCFLYFRKKQCDTAVLEVGLGGRGDSTNIIKAPLASVITSISYDHMDRLGDTIEEIAGEKAGIIKAGCPVIVSTERPDALEVFRKKAEETGSALYDAREMAEYEVLDAGPDGCDFDVRIDNGKAAYKSLHISMGGMHQVTNAVEALTALYVLRDRLDMTEDEIREGFGRAVQPGRFEVMYRPQKTGHPWVVIDGAHNQDGAAKLKEAMETFFPGKRVLIVTGMLADKDVDGMLDQLTSFSTDMIAAEPENDRKLSAYDLASKIHDRNIMVYEIPRPEDAAAMAMSLGKAYDVVLFSGSLYLIGRIRTVLREHYLSPDNICFDREDREDSFTVGVTEEGDD